MGWLGLFVLVVSGAGSHVRAQDLVADLTADPAFSRLLGTVRERTPRPGREQETVRLLATEDGAIEYLGAPPDHDFPAPRTTFRDPESAARAFLQQQGALFGIRSTAVDFTTTAVRARKTGVVVKLAQTYAGLPVFAAEVKVQVNGDLGIDAVMADVGRNTADLDAGRLSVRPAVSADDAVRRLEALVQREVGRVRFAVGKPTLVVYDPAILDLPGPVRLAWQINAATEDGVTLDEDILLDAHTGEVLNRVTHLHSALDREIYDASNANADPGTLVRDEGQAASGITDADNVYAFYADTYNFYSSNHGRDSFDDGGSTLEATVRFCNTNLPAGGCAFLPQNAMWSNSKQRMYFGPGTAVDDVTGHEVTHGVTRNESGLIYQNASGAINESFSDLWGEFIDLANGAGNDTAGVRWLVGEDWVTGGIRDMAQPQNFSHPDRLSSAFYLPSTNAPSGSNDNGGVHTNSGVNNKLCYLLVDGDTFNGQTVTGMGIARVADLYYEAQTGLLTQSAGWTQLYNALQQAAVNLGWTIAERNNLFRACLAVEIAAPRNLWVNNSVNCIWPANGQADCAIVVPFFLPFGGSPFPTVTQGHAAAYPGDRLRVVTGTYSESVTLVKRLRLVPSGGPVVIGLP